MQPIRSARPKRAAAAPLAECAPKPKRAGGYNAGPGRSIHTKVTQTASHLRLLNATIKATSQLASHLASTTADHSRALELKQELRRLDGLLMAAALKGQREVADPIIAASLRQIVRLQLPHRTGNSERTRRRLKADLKQVLCNQSADIQVEVLESVLESLGRDVRRDQATQSSARNDAAQSVVDSLHHSLFVMDQIYQNAH